MNRVYKKFVSFDESNRYFACSVGYGVGALFAAVFLFTILYVFQHNHPQYFPFLWIIAGGVVALLILVSVWCWRMCSLGSKQHNRRLDGCCVSCNYSLKGTEPTGNGCGGVPITWRCPECGQINPPKS